MPEAPTIDAAPAAPAAAQPNMTDAFSDLDAFVKNDPAPPAEKPAAPAVKDKPPAPPKAPDKPPVEKKDEAPKPPEVKKDTPEEKAPEKLAPKELRTAYETLKAKHKELEKQHAELKSKPPEPQKDDGEKAELAKRFEAAEKRRQELEEEFRYVDYERSAEYREKYQAPYEETCRSALAQVSELKVENEDGTFRAPTAEEFWKIVTIPNANDALEAAEEMFGSASKATFVVNWRERVRSQWAAAEKAKEDFRAKGGEIQKQREQQMQQRSKAQTETWNKLNSEAVEKYPQWFKPEEGDEKGNTLLEKGFALADKAFSGAPGMTPEEAIKVHSAVRNKAAGFDRAVFKLKTAQSRIAELEKQIAEYEASGPSGGLDKSGGAGSRGAAKSEMEEAERELEKLQG